MALGLSACATLSDGYADNLAGIRARAEMCKGMRSFVRAPLDDTGLRRAWFLPLGSYDDGSFDFYAPMASTPSDEYSSAFYSSGVGQLTHYHVMPSFASSISKCLSTYRGFSRDTLELTEDSFRVSIRDRRLDRNIEILATSDSTNTLAGGATSILIADATWDGDIDQALDYKASRNCED